ncbi:uncharacterized protein LOC133246211 [Bos javanicus]|uniref:uncharacterized protein LOC133246211 n=1 Tax=Bos javanicus TaxID=9906 RepID=UPI002AA75EFF|nr:uncharacterized protein LOC133246211 [Bos javanicus]
MRALLCAAPPLGGSPIALFFLSCHPPAAVVITVPLVTPLGERKWINRNVCHSEDERRPAANGSAVMRQVTLSFPQPGLTSRWLFKEEISHLLGPRLHFRLEDVPGSWPGHTVKSRGREPRFLTPSRKRVDHRPISISPPRGRGPATVPSEAGRKKPGGRRRLSSPQQRASSQDATGADGRRHRCARPGPRGLPRLRVPAVARRARGPAGRAGPSAHTFALSAPWSPSLNYCDQPREKSPSFPELLDIIHWM